MKFKLESFLSKKAWYFYSVFIVLLVTLPFNNSSSLNNIFILELRSDYLLHSLLFVLWFFFNRIFAVSFLTWFGSGYLFAMLAEVIQYFLSYRAFNINDLLASLLGISIGCGAVIIGRWWFNYVRIN